MSEPITALVARRRPEWDALGELLVLLRAGKLQLVELERLDRLCLPSTSATTSPRG